MNLAFLKQRVHELGWCNAAKILLLHFESMAFDWRNGTDTRQRVPLRQLNIPFGTRVRGRDYDPSPLFPLRKALSEIGIGREDIFVDFGSGKGRCLLIASEFPFCRIVGVEFSTTLCGIAAENVRRFRARHPCVPPIDIIEADAAEVCIEPDWSVLYFFNPFDAQILQRVLAKIEQSYLAHPRRIRLLYYHPVCGDLVEKYRFLHRERDFHIMGRQISWYQTIAPRRHQNRGFDRPVVVEPANRSELQ